jgi:hypothetical protein
MMTRADVAAIRRGLSDGEARRLPDGTVLRRRYTPPEIANIRVR